MTDTTTTPLRLPAAEWGGGGVKPYYDDPGMTLYHGDVLDVLRELPDESVQCVITSPPYWGLRDYGTPGQLGLEPTPDAYVANMVAVFAEVRRVLRSDGTCWLNLGDSYAAARGGTHQPAETLAGGSHGMTTDGGRVNRSRHDGYNPSRNAHAIGLKHKDLVGIPWRVAFALQADGWWLRSDIIWFKPNPMPESVTDRPTKSHEYLFLLTKSSRYMYDADAIAEDAAWERWGDQTVIKPQHGTASWIKPKSKQELVGNRRYDGVNGRWDANPDKPKTRNKRSVWTVATQPYSGAHFATFPPKLIEPCILAGSREGDTVLDPFMGSGTTALVARKHGRKSIGIDINADYLDLAIQRNAQQTLWFTEAAS